MSALLLIARGVDRTTTILGQAVSWLLLVAVVLSAANAIGRKFFGFASNALLEMQWYLFGAVFMLAAAWALQQNEHVRIDVLASSLKKATRDWIDLICHIIFLMPFIVVMAWLSWPFFLKSFSSGEVSMNTGGLVLWPAKGLIATGFLILIAQAYSEIVKRIAVIRGDIPDPYANLGEELPPAVREMEDQELLARVQQEDGRSNHND